MSHPPLDRHPLLREISVGRLFGWPLVAVTLAAGLGCGLLAVTTAGPLLLARSPEALLIPGVIPVCFAIARGSSLLSGLIAGLFAATLAFLLVGAYAVWHAVCFVITFMGEC